MYKLYNKITKTKKNNKIPKLMVSWMGLRWKFKTDGISNRTGMGIERFEIF